MLAEAVATASRVKALRALVDEKNLLAEELQHRVRNNLQMVTSMLASYARTAIDVSARQGIDLIVRHVTTLAQVYDSLLGVGLSDTVDLGDYLRSFASAFPGCRPNGAEMCISSATPIQFCWVWIRSPRLEWWSQSW